MTATALENHLSVLESKIDEVLAAFGENVPQDQSNEDKNPEKEEGNTQTSDINSTKSSR